MPASDFLEKILEHKKSLIAQNNPFFANIKDKLSGETYTRYHLFKKQISKPDQINLIAEIKKASPSQGVIREDFDVLAIAKTYVGQNAAAISVLTEDKFFLGKPQYIKKITDELNVPVLTKDFIIDEGQIFEARYHGASAILLIAAILEDKELTHLMDVAHRLDLDCLVEIHDENELKRVIDVGAEIIGINHRNLKTFEVDLSLSEKLIPKIPKGKVIVVESGIENHDQVAKFHEMGAHAVLIGETFMRSDDIGKKVQEVMVG